MRELVMKFERSSQGCSELLEEYLAGDEAAEQELFRRYDRELEVTPQLWVGIEEQIAPVARSSFNWWTRIAAGLVLMIGFLSVFLLSQKNESIAVVQLPEPPPVSIQRQNFTANR